MTAAMQPSLAAMSAAGLGDALRAPFEVGSAEGLHAVWESVLERTRDIEAVVAAAIQTPLLSHELNAASMGDELQSSANAAAKFAARTEPASAESVSVFVQGATVAVVVRDTAIAAQTALRCAFHTARELTGQRAALRQLTLNGRIVYQQHSDTAACDSMHGSKHAAPMLAFAC